MDHLVPSNLLGTAIQRLDDGSDRPALRGTVLGVVCDGSDLKQIVADGKNGHYYKLFKQNHPPCGGELKHPPEGALLGMSCQGKNRVGQYADGRGSFTWQVIERDSRQCGGLHGERPFTGKPADQSPAPSASINPALMPPALQSMDSFSLPQVKL